MALYPWSWNFSWSPRLRATANENSAALWAIEAREGLCFHSGKAVSVNRCNTECVSSRTVWRGAASSRCSSSQSVQFKPHHFYQFLLLIQLSVKTHQFRLHATTTAVTESKITETSNCLTLWRPLLPDRFKPSWAPECPDVKNYKWRLNPVWQRMLYSCDHMAGTAILVQYILCQTGLSRHL